MSAFVVRAFPLLVPFVAAGAYVVAALPAGARGSAYLGLHSLLALLMGLAWRWRVAGRALLAASWASLVVLFAAPPFTTHDVDRYLWDGAVAAAGHDPYRVTPRSPEVAPLLALWQTPPEHAEHTTLYPPLALALFAACASLGPSLAFWAWKLIVTMAGLALVWLVARRWGDSATFAWVALSPLLLLEVGVGAHVDVLAALAVLVSLHFFARERAGLAGVAAGLGMLIKLTPLLLVVPLVAALLGAGVRRARVVALLAGAATAVTVGYGAALLVGLVPIGSFGTFFAKWSFGNPLWLQVGEGSREPALIAAAVCGFSLLLVAFVMAARGAVERGALVALAAPLAVSPVIFPWYLLPLVPLLATVPSRLVLGWTLSLPLTYEVIDRFDVDGTWSPSALPLACVLGGWVVAIAWAMRAQRRAIL